MQYHGKCAGGSTGVQDGKYENTIMKTLRCETKKCFKIFFFFFRLLHQKCFF